MEATGLVPSFPERSRVKPKVREEAGKSVRSTARSWYVAGMHRKSCLRELVYNMVLGTTVRSAGSHVLWLKTPAAVMVSYLHTWRESLDLSDQE